jgi:hypothetical protein
MFFMIWMISYAMKRVKNNSFDGLLLHLCYWAGFAPLSAEHNDAMSKEFYQ